MRNTARVAWIIAALARLQSPMIANTEPFRIVTTTSLLKCAVKEVGGNHVKVSVLIAPGSCPGHYDICPKDLKTLSASKALFTHGYEGFVPKIMDALGSRKPKQIAIRTNGNWMVPSVYVSALKQVTDALCAFDPAHSSDYRESCRS